MMMMIASKSNASFAKLNRRAPTPLKWPQRHLAGKNHASLCKRATHINQRTNTGRSPLARCPELPAVKRSHGAQLR
jgi:hypothetical protein